MYDGMIFRNNLSIYDSKIYGNTIVMSNCWWDTCTNSWPDDDNGNDAKDGINDNDDNGDDEILAQTVGSPRPQDFPPQTTFPGPTFLQKIYFTIFRKNLEISATKMTFHKISFKSKEDF